MKFEDKVIVRIRSEILKSNKQVKKHNLRGNLGIFAMGEVNAYINVIEMIEKLNEDKKRILYNFINFAFSRDIDILDYTILADKFLEEETLENNEEEK